MLFHHVFEQMHWGNFYHLLCASSFYFLTKSIFFENTITGPTRSYWGNPYHLLCASPLYSPTGALGKPLPFTMCFPILFPGGRTGETPIIYYVLPHRVHSIPRRAHCHWGNLYYLLCASPSYSPTGSIFFENTITGSTRSYWGNPYHLLCASPSCSPTGALPLGKPLLFNWCFPIGSGYWGNLYYILCASPSYSPAGALGTPLLFTMCFPIGSCSPAGALPLGNPLLFCMCFPIVFFGERIAIGETSTI